MHDREEVERALEAWRRLGSADAAARETGVACGRTIRRWVTRGVPHERRCRVVPSLPRGGSPAGGRAAVELPDELPDDPAALREIIRAQREENLALAMERDLMREVVAIVKKGPAADLAALTNREKALVVEALRGTYSVTSLASRLSIAPSTYYHQRAAMRRPDARAARLAAAAPDVAAAFARGRGAYGYRRVCALLRSSGTPLPERLVRESMRAQGLEARCSRAGRGRWSSYAGEAPGTPPNLLLVDEGRDLHCFRAPEPGLALSSDVTEMRCADGKVYASVVLDLFDGAPLALAASTRPDAALADSSLAAALDLCPERPGGVIVATDRGCHYRWPGWLALCRERGVVRSMSRKGHSPDNAPAEGFFGTMKVEMYRGLGWERRTCAELIEALAEYREWYLGERVKESLGWTSPRRYRAEHGLPPV